MYKVFNKNFEKIYEDLTDAMWMASEYSACVVDMDTGKIKLDLRIEADEEG